MERNKLFYDILIEIDKKGSIYRTDLGEDFSKLNTILKMIKIGYIEKTEWNNGKNEIEILYEVSNSGYDFIEKIDSKHHKWKDKLFWLFIGFVFSILVNNSQMLINKYLLNPQEKAIQPLKFLLVNDTTLYIHLNTCKK